MILEFKSPAVIFNFLKKLPANRRTFEGIFAVTIVHFVYSSTENAETKNVEKQNLSRKMKIKCGKICCTLFSVYRKEFGSDLTDFWKIRGHPHYFWIDS